MILKTQGTMNELRTLQTKIGYQFKDLDWLELALTHKSAGVSNNESLEFLGDSILNMLTSEYIVNQNPMQSEGFMSQMRSNVVCNRNLFTTALKLNLGAYLRLGRGEAMNDGRNKASILADAVEALIAAIYKDGGLWAARDFVARWIWV